MEHNFEANFFTLLEFLDAGSRLQIDAVCTRLSAGPQEVIYAQGASSDSIYIVASGVVETLTHSEDGTQTRSVGFMGRGDFFGDLGVLTGHSRLAVARACEETELLQIEKLAFLNLLEKIPKLGAYFTRNLARRLHQTSTKAHLSVYDIDLAGNLRHFDLLTIFQAITNMGRSGELQLNNSSNELIGSFFFSSGRVEHARYVHLEGVEAVWQGFVQSCSDGSFSFRVMDQPTVTSSEANQIELGCTDLLIQGVTRRDTYNALPEAFREMQGRLGRVAELLVWTDDATQVIAGKIWDLMARRPQPIASMWRRLSYSSLTYLEVVSQLITSGQAEWIETVGPEPQTDTQPLPNPTKP